MAAIIAPLSVQRLNGGILSSIPLASHCSLATSLSLELATTPPPSNSLGTSKSLHALIAFLIRTSTTASLKLAATSPTENSSPLDSASSTCLATAVFSPEKLKS